MPNEFKVIALGIQTNMHWFVYGALVASKLATIILAHVGLHVTLGKLTFFLASLDFFFVMIFNLFSNICGPCSLWRHRLQLSTHSWGMSRLTTVNFRILTICETRSSIVRFFPWTLKVLCNFFQAFSNASLKGPYLPWIDTKRNAGSALYIALLFLQWSLEASTSGGTASNSGGHLHLFLDAKSNDLRWAYLCRHWALQIQSFGKSLPFFLTYFQAPAIGRLGRWLLHAMFKLSLR